MEPFVICRHCGEDFPVSRLMPDASYESNDRNEDTLTFGCPSCKDTTVAVIHLRHKES